MTSETIEYVYEDVNRGPVDTGLKYLMAQNDADEDETASAENDLSLLRGKVAALAAELDAERTRASETAMQAELRGRESAFREASHLSEQRAVASVQKVEALLNSLDKARALFLKEVEGEVVELSLDIARKIMHHQAQVDPCFLMGAVRVALEKMERTIETRVEVPLKDAAAWDLCLAPLRQGGRMIKVEGVAGWQTGDCVCRTAIETIDLSVDRQMQELGRSFCLPATVRSLQSSEEED